MRTGATSCVAALLLLGGCVMYETRQSARFIDNDGRFLSVDYQRGDGDHESTYFYNGAERAFRSNLRVVVELPDGDTFKAYECIDPRLRGGTAYKSTDEQWLVQACGTIVRVWRAALNRKGESDFLLLFEGVMCQPKKGVRW